LFLCPCSTTFCICKHVHSEHLCIWASCANEIFDGYHSPFVQQSANPHQETPVRILRIYVGYIPHEHDIEQFFELIHELISREITFLKCEVPDISEAEFTADIVYGPRCV